MAKKNNKLGFTHDDSIERIKHNKKELLEILKKNMCNISDACDKVMICRTTFYNYINSDNEFKENYESLLERNIDFAESKLLQSINAGSDTATIFYLKTKGRKRGYVDVVENNVNMSNPIINLKINNEEITLQ